MPYTLIYVGQANKDAIKLKRAGFKEKAEYLLEILTQNSFQNPPPYEKLKGDYQGFYSRRINVQHRLIYEVLKEQKIVKIARMWTHYE